MGLFFKKFNKFTSCLRSTLLILLVIFGGLFSSYTQAADLNQGVTVNATVPGGGGGTGGGGGGGSGGDASPQIFSVTTSVVTTTATVIWGASDDLGITTSSFVYGTSIGYGFSGSIYGSYRTDLTGLTAGTLYYFKISVTDTGLHTTEYLGTFSTLPGSADTTLPIISGVQIETGITTTTIQWNTHESADSQINYGLTNSYGSNYFDSALDLGHSAFLLNLIPNTTYHFQIISTDSSGNSGSTSDATFVTKPDDVPPPDVSNFILTTAASSFILSWTNPSLSGTPDFSGVKVIRKIGSPSANPGDGVEVYAGTGENFTDFNVLKNTNYFYTIFSFDTSNNRSPGIFRNGQISSETTPTISSCLNGVDDDNDGKIDYPEDPGCESVSDTDEYNLPEENVPEFAKVNLADLKFWAGNRHIMLEPVGDLVTGLFKAGLTVAVPENVLIRVPKTMVLRVGNTDQHQFLYNSTDKMYYADLFFNTIGTVQSYVEIDYGSNQFDSVGFNLNGLPLGRVIDEKGNPIAGVEATLFGGTGSIVPMGYYGQINPIITDANGNFGWMTQNVSFKIELYKQDYYDRSVSINNVQNNVINSEFILLSSIPRPTSTLEDKVGDFTDKTIQKFDDLISDPDIQEINQQVVAPAAIAIVTLGALSFISWLDLIPLLRLLFLQPLMLLGWRKRDKWGLVYNSLNKLPVDLATVRLINLETNRVVQSKVTDSKGRFIFIVDPGKYRLDVQKHGFIFPSIFLQGYTTDGQKVDIYHNEAIAVDKASSITVNIPLDPVGVNKKPFRLSLEKFGRGLQTAISLIGIFVTAISLYISPKLYIAVLLGVHILLFFIFRKLAVPSKPKNWGIVHDELDKAPVSGVIARLFNSQFNKLVDTQITDSSGKYSFLAGDAKYYITYEHKAYHPQKTEIIDLAGKDAEVITVDINLKKH